MKGIIFVVGAGTHLSALNKSVSKRIIPVYDKPMNYHPLGTLVLAGMKKFVKYFNAKAFTGI